jgi:hypothetical protein
MFEWLEECQKIVRRVLEIVRRALEELSMQARTFFILKLLLRSRKRRTRTTSKATFWVS